MDQSVREPIAEPSGRPGAWFRMPSKIRDLEGLPAVLARSGSLEARLATTRQEIRHAQRLRYEIFYEQGDAVPDRTAMWLRRDKCPFDRACDHLIIVDTSLGGRTDFDVDVVGTYRLLRGEKTRKRTGFYSSTAFDIAPMLDRHRGTRFLELGRSCVHPAYRSRRVIDLLWQGIGLYAAHHGIDVLIGCSSLQGSTPADLSLPLSFAFHHAAAAERWQVEPLPHRAQRMDWLTCDAVDPRRGLAALPPLMKAYVRAGGTFASRAAVDLQFGTTDLFTVLPLAVANPRHLAHFGVATRKVA